jgi:hypothetical protein
LLVFKVDDNHIKDLMNKIFKTTLFDEFEVRNIEISSFTKFEISGLLSKNSINNSIEDETISHCTWLQIKPYVLNIIKGNITPSLIKITFSLPKALVTSLHHNGRAMFLNFHFENKELIFRTASTEKEFKMDKNIDIILNNYIINFFKSNNIPIDILE